MKRVHGAVSLVVIAVLAYLAWKYKDAIVSLIENRFPSLLPAIQVNSGTELNPGAIEALPSVAQMRAGINAKAGEAINSLLLADVGSFIVRGPQDAK